MQNEKYMTIAVTLVRGSQLWLRRLRVANSAPAPIAR
jgi:hypothetical protein